MRIRVKICCISSREEAAIAVRAGADAVGLVARMPSGPGPISDGLIRGIAVVVPPPIATFLLTSRTTADGVVEHVRGTGVNTVQLVDDTLGEGVWTAMRRELPAVRIVQVVHVRDESSVDLAAAAAERVDALLLDSGNPAARELGGTGRVHDWSISRRIVARSRIPIFLAGGLNAGNVAEAIRAVRPFGVDVCSGVRTGGALDAVKVQHLVDAVRECERSFV